MSLAGLVHSLDVETIMESLDTCHSVAARVRFSFNDFADQHQALWTVEQQGMVRVLSRDLSAVEVMIERTVDHLRFVSSTERLSQITNDARLHTHAMSLWNELVASTMNRVRLMESVLDTCEQVVFQCEDVIVLVAPEVLHLPTDYRAMFRLFNDVSSVMLNVVGVLTDSD